MSKPNSINFITNTKKLFHIFIFYPAGSIYEDERTRGISHLLEHLLLKHTKQYTEKQLLHEITAVGGNNNATTDHDATCYYIMAHMDNYKACIDIMHSCVKEPVFTDYELNMERKVVIEEINRLIDQNNDMINKSLLTILSPQNKYSGPVEGYIQTLNTITVADLRAYMARRYKQEMVFINCDAASKKHVMDYATKRFGSIKPINFDEPVLKKEFGLETGKGCIFVEVKPQRRQYNTHILFPTYPRKEGFRKNSIVEFIMFCLVSSGLYSILYTELRSKRGLIYGIKSTNAVYRYQGFLRINVSTSSNKTDYIIGIILTELLKICKSGFSPRKLSYFRKAMINARKFFLTNDDNKSIITGEGLFYNASFDVVEVLRSITNEDVIEVARDVFRLDSMGILTFGRYKNQTAVTARINDLVETYKNMSVY